MLFVYRRNKKGTHLIFTYYNTEQDFISEMEIKKIRLKNYEK